MTNEHEIPILLSINKVLLEQRHVHSFPYYIWLLSCYNSRVEQLLQRPYGLQSPEKVCPTLNQITGGFVWSQKYKTCTPKKVVLGRGMWESSAYRLTEAIGPDEFVQYAILRNWNPFRGDRKREVALGKRMKKNNQVRERIQQQRSPIFLHKVFHILWAAQV